MALTGDQKIRAGLQILFECSDQLIVYAIDLLFSQ